MADFTAVPSHVPTVHHAYAARPLELDACVAQSSLIRMSTEWGCRHVGILGSALGEMKIPKAVRRICQEAEGCVCKGEGRALLTFARKWQDAFKVWKDAVGEKAWALAARQGYLVLCF